jgi:hypothetical protein
MKDEFEFQRYEYKGENLLSCKDIPHHMVFCVDPNSWEFRVPPPPTMKQRVIEFLARFPRAAKTAWHIIRTGYIG